MPRTLDQWLAYQQTLHVKDMELGLVRVREVAERLSLLQPAFRVMTVAGTNGKGSCVALAAGLLEGQASIGCYTSPHLWHYSERVVIDGTPVEEAMLLSAFEAVERARRDTALTFFEFATLSALWIFARQAVDVAILEVGLGGRLDAVNILDAEVAMITNIGLDHTQWLGSTREAIGREKAGIMRPGQPVVCGDRHPPVSLAEQASACGADLACIGQSFDIRREGEVWHWADQAKTLTLPVRPAVHADNLALAIAACRILGVDPDQADAARAVWRQMQLPGRREMIDGPIPIVYDVCHNEEAAALLVDTMQAEPVSGVTHVVLGMLADKSVEALGQRLGMIADRWYPAGLGVITDRGLSGDELAVRLGYSGPWYDHPESAFSAALRAAENGDRIIVCGSFFTVAQVRKPWCGVHQHE